MLRLTLRSGEDGRFLARIMDRDGFAFVLDYGDSEVVADASRRLLRGFTVFRWGQLVEAQGQGADLLPLLAELYMQEGYLVFLEEPNWPQRAHSLEDRLPGPFSSAVRDLEDEGHGDDELLDLLEHEDESTEIVSLNDLPTVDTALETAGPTRIDWEPPVDIDETGEDFPTQVAVAPMQSRSFPIDEDRTELVPIPSHLLPDKK